MHRFPGDVALFKDNLMNQPAGSESAEDRGHRADTCDQRWFQINLGRSHRILCWLWEASPRIFADVQHGNVIHVRLLPIRRRRQEGSE